MTKLSFHKGALRDNPADWWVNQRGNIIALDQRGRHSHTKIIKRNKLVLPALAPKYAVTLAIKRAYFFTVNQ